MRGRKPKPTELKILAGTRKDRVNGAEPKPQAGRPEPPGRFDDETKAEWARLCDVLQSLGVLNASHGFALAVYCGAYQRLLLAEQALKEHGPLLVTGGGTDDEGNDVKVVIKSNPAAAMAAKSEATMARVLLEFGLTPSSVSRIRAQAQAPADKFSEFLEKKGR